MNATSNSDIGFENWLIVIYHSIQPVIHKKSSALSVQSLSDSEQYHRTREN